MLIEKYFPDLTSHQLQQFSSLKAIYEAWNARINVISRKDMDEFYLKHVLHSLAIARIIQFVPDTKILDVGTGGGFPGIPLAIYFPEVSFTLVDSIGKKIKVVQAVSDELDLKNVKSYHQRAEEVKGQFDFVVSRAVTRTSRFLPWVEVKVKKGNKNELPNGFLFLKGGELAEELKEAGRPYREYELKSYFEEDFFETKKLIYIKA
jgi:16S rRNA (guanine527-N7)-methyltransferase